MQLSEWLATNKIAVNQIAKEWGLDPAHLGRRINGKFLPTYELICRAYVTSSGAVTLKDWMALNAKALEEKGLRVPK